MQRFQELDFAPHIADGRDSIRDEQGNDEFSAAGRLASAGEVQVHVSQSGDQKFPGAIDNVRVSRNCRGTGRANSDNP